MKYLSKRELTQIEFPFLLEDIPMGTSFTKMSSGRYLLDGDIIQLPDKVFDEIGEKKAD